jgi:hypothetical protein
MADSLIKTGFCDDLISEFDKKFGDVLSAEAKALSAVRAVEEQIASVVEWSPDEIINDLKQEIASSVNSLVPDLSAFDELTSLVNACLFTRNDARLSKPSAMARNLTGSMLSNANTALNTMGGMIPEFQVGNLTNALQKLLGASGYFKLIPDMKQILTCASVICGRDITSRANALVNFANQFCIDPTSGTFNISDLLVLKGMPTTPAQAATELCNQVASIETSITASCEAGAKQLLKSASSISVPGTGW